jgi:hypothetical protein
MVTEWCKDGHEDKDNNEDFLYIIDLPNPYDIGSPWVEIGQFNSRKEMIDFAQKTFGADEEGKIDICNILPKGE